MRTVDSASSDLSMAGLAAIGVIACAFGLDWLRQFWNSPRDLTTLVEFKAGLEYDGRQLGFRQALPSGLVGMLLVCSAILLSELGASLLVACLLLLAAAPAGVLTVIVWLTGRPERLIIPALRDRKVKELG